MTQPSSILDTINGPADLKPLQPAELRILAGEIRERIRNVVNRTGGHLASNLGVVELTLALHYIYDFTWDRLVWDGGHQAYAHKIITGRNKTFDTLRTAGGVSGFPTPQESPCDPFIVGHAGTAISTALGLLCANDTAPRPASDAPVRPPRRVVAVVGDASIASGMSFEALNHAGSLGKRLLVVLNDNRMAISGTVGALSKYLNRIRVATLYNEVKREVRDFLDAIPVVGRSMERIVEHVKDGVRKSLVPGGIFEEMGFRYFGPTDGHDVRALIDVLHEIERLDINGPVLLHVITEKGRGCEKAHADPRKFHGVSPGQDAPPQSCPEQIEDKTVLNGKIETNVPPLRLHTYTDVFADELLRIAEENPRVCAITAAMPDGTGLARFADQFPDRFFDVGICEQHALGLASGLAVGGARPVAAIYSTFLQRAYDQVFQEISLQNAPVVLALDRAGLVGSDGPPHHGTFDIACLRTLPRIVLMAPADAEELRMMLRFALTLQVPVALRYPRTKLPAAQLPAPEPIQLGRASLLTPGTDAALIAYGSMVAPAFEAAGLLANEGRSVAVLNARFARPLDEDLFRKTLSAVPVALTVEEGSVQGGFGEAVLRFCSEAGLPAKVHVAGVPDRYVSHGGRDPLLAELGLDAQGLAHRLRALL